MRVWTLEEALEALPEVRVLVHRLTELAEVPTVTPQERRLLLEAYLKLGYHSEAVDAARQLQAKVSDDVTAMRALAIGLAATLAVSGVVEAFVTPSGLPTWARVGIGVVVWLAFLAYVAVLGGRAVRVHPLAIVLSDDPGTADRKPGSGYSSESRCVFRLARTSSSLVAARALGAPSASMSV